jgi:dihydropyrimidinase
MLLGKIAPERLGELTEEIQAGHASVKMFTTDVMPSRRGCMVDFGDIWEVLKVLAQAGGIAAIHPEDNDIVMHMYEKLTREDRTGFENMAEVHNTLSEDLSFNRVIRLAANIEGAALYMMHTSAKTGVDAIAAARAKGVPIYGETLHQYLSRPSRNQTGISNALRPRPYGIILDDLPIHIRPNLPAARVQT